MKRPVSTPGRPGASRFPSGPVRSPPSASIPGAGRRALRGGPLTQAAALPQMGIELFLHGSGVACRFPREADSMVPSGAGTRAPPGKSAGRPLIP